MARASLGAEDTEKKAMLVVAVGKEDTQVEPERQRVEAEQWLVGAGGEGGGIRHDSSWVWGLPLQVMKNVWELDRRQSPA